MMTEILFLSRDVGRMLSYWQREKAYLRKHSDKLVANIFKFKCE
jgi:hypothetical protein